MVPLWQVVANRSISTRTIAVQGGQNSTKRYARRGGAAPKTTANASGLQATRTLSLGLQPRQAAGEASLLLPSPLWGRQGPSWASSCSGPAPCPPARSRRPPDRMSKTHRTALGRGDALSGFEVKRAGIDPQQP